MVNFRLLALVGESLGLDDEEVAALHDADAEFVAALLIRADEAGVAHLVEALSRTLYALSSSAELPFAPSELDLVDRETRADRSPSVIGSRPI